MRHELSNQWITGSGLELGPCHAPLPVKEGVQVTYIDIKTIEELQKEAPQLDVKKLPTVIDNAETLSQFKNATQDFVMSSHVAEHLENLLGAFENWLRVLKSGGVILAFLPNKDHCFDRRREVTSLVHLIADASLGPYTSLLEHYRDWYYNSELEGLDKNTEEQLEQKIAQSMKDRNNIHFHCFTLHSLEILAQYLKETYPIKHIQVRSHGAELILIAQKA